METLRTAFTTSSTNARPPGGERRKAMETRLELFLRMRDHVTAGGRTPKGNGDDVGTFQRPLASQTAGGRTPKGNGDSPAMLISEITRSRPPGGERRKAMETSRTRVMVTSKS